MHHMTVVLFYYCCEFKRDLSYSSISCNPPLSLAEETLEDILT